MTKGSMREQMPVVAALIDEMRKTFGEANIDKVIRRGMRGEPVFYASENGHEVGTRPPPRAAPPEWIKSPRELMLDRQYKLLAIDRETSMDRSKQVGSGDKKGVK